MNSPANLDDEGLHPVVRRHYERRGMLALLTALADAKQDYQFRRDGNGEVEVSEIQGREMSAENLIAVLGLAGV